jgi:hypothetical protein
VATLSFPLCSFLSPLLLLWLKPTSEEEEEEEEEEVEVAVEEVSGLELVAETAKEKQNKQ